MDFILSLATRSMGQVWQTFLHNWPYLAASVIIASLLKLYLNGDKVSAFLNRYRGAGVIAATTAAVATPLCSCGTMAVILGMMTSRMSWAPIVAFMVASPLTSPEGLVYSAGLFGWPFAWAFYLASIVLGLIGGWCATIVERRGWLANQARFTEAISNPCACAANTKTASTPGYVFSLDMPGIMNAAAITGCCTGTAPTGPATSCGCGQAEIILLGEDPGESNPRPDAPHQPAALAAFLYELYRNGKYLLVMFTGFAFIGYFLNALIPASWVATVFGGGNIYNVPLAAILGLPLYVNSEASLPLIRALLDNGMSQGAALAFLISGAGTSIGAIAGALTIARWRVVGLVVGVLLGGAILSGFAFNLVLMWNQ